MSKDTDKTPLQFQAAKISLELMRLMEQIHRLTEEVLALQQLVDISAKMDTIDWGKGKWRKADE
jgi:hypothetical protein